MALEYDKTTGNQLFFPLFHLRLKFRIGKVGNQKRVVGVLLGSWQKKVLDVSNSFAGKTHIDSIFLGGGVIQIDIDIWIMPYCF